MNNFIITLLFGWLGVHKFMQKKYGMGILYLCTMGLCGIGWTIDTIIAFVRMVSGNQQVQNTQNANIYYTGTVPSVNNLTGGNQIFCNQIKKYTQPQLEGMKKSDILAMATGLGYTMTTIESDTKDRIVADFIAQQEKQPSTNNRKWLIKSFNTEIVGTFAKCDLARGYTREEIICSLKPNSRVYLEYWEYKGEPAYYVCCQGKDAGNIPATLSKTIHEIYNDCELVVELRGTSSYNYHNDLIQKIKIDIYK